MQLVRRLTTLSASCLPRHLSPARSPTSYRSHGWLIVSRADLDSVALSPADFSTWSYVCGDTLALDEYGDMPKFLKRLDERGIPYRLHDRRMEGDTPFGNIGPATPALRPRQADRAERTTL